MADAELAGQVALVAGGGRGIGARIAAELAGAGMQVAVAARSREQIEQVASQIGGIAVRADERLCIDMVADLRQMGWRVEREESAAATSHHSVLRSGE